MSANTSITEGGKARPFGPVKALMVQGSDGKYYPWFPESDRALGTLSVDKNGVYKASDKDVYGWSRVSVNVPQKEGVRGRDPDTGEEVEVHPDPETGEIVKTVIPVEIRVTTPPTKTAYTHGETIDYSGIVVHAYSSTGQDMGAVPFNELVFPETTADVQKTDEWTDGQGLNAKMLYYTPKYGAYVNPNTGEAIKEYTSYLDGSLSGIYEGHTAAYSSLTAPSTRLITRYNGQNYMATIAGTREISLACNFADELIGSRIYRGWLGVASTSALSGDNTFNAIGPFSDIITGAPVSTVNPTTIDPTNLHATQSLPVQWPRTGDGAVLETTFDILVGPHGGTGDD